MEKCFRENDVAIVASSCLLPGSNTPEEFWKNCIDQKVMAKTLSDERLKKHLYGKSRNPTDDKIYSFLACEIPGERFRHLDKNKFSTTSDLNRLHSYTSYCVSELMQGFKMPAKRGRFDFILGCMNPDTDHELQIMRQKKAFYLADLLQKFTSQSEDFRKQLALCVDKAVEEYTADVVDSNFHFFTSHVLNFVKNDFGILGESFVVDAACASSIIAIEMAVQKLRLYEADCIISGGVESNLGNGAYMIFSKVGALAEQESLPFDQRTQGLVQGEGAVLFALKRLEDALQDQDNIQAVIRGIAGSSDGRSASLFQPNLDGQLRVYSKIYKEDRRLDYLEAHGTGTLVGDQIEKSSIEQFFSGQSLPVGSAKALVGHTKGAAGATGILKALRVMKEKIAPASSYGYEPIYSPGTNQPFLNTSVCALQADSPMRVGVNSFGFGGTNYHILLEEFKPDTPLQPAVQFKKQELCVLAESRFELSGFQRPDFFKYDFPFKLPPASVSAIDCAQLGGLLGAWECIKSIGPTWSLLPRQKINVVSACTLFLDQSYDVIDRLAYEDFATLAERDFPNEDSSRLLRKYVNEEVRLRYAPLNEDAATGILNNVIAGRICNIFDLFGKSYNLDKDIASIPACLTVIQNDLSIDPDQLFIFVGIEEAIAECGTKTERKAVMVKLITSRSFALENELTVRSILKVQRSTE